MSDKVRTGLATLYGKSLHADFVLQFCVERPPEFQGQGSEPGHLILIRDPLPAHKTVLTLASSVISALLERLDCSSEQRPKRQKTDASVQHPLLPTLLVPLRSAFEEPYAREAIKYAYCGTLGEGLGAESLLRIREQASYLDIEDCVRACDREILLLTERSTQRKQKQQQEQQQHQGPAAAGTSTSSNGEESAFVLEAYRCNALFPEPGTAPHYDSFKATLAGLEKGLVSHFRDALSALTVPHLYRQLLQLPACAVEALLRSDDFGTDCESTVLLMLACWVEANADSLTAETRTQLCGLVRLSHLSRAYASFVLPHCEWFDISRPELCFLQRYMLTHNDNERRLLLLSGVGLRFRSAWFKAPPRRQAVPMEGRTVTWHLTQEQLEQGLREVKDTGANVVLQVCFHGEGTPVFQAKAAADSATADLDPAASTSTTTSSSSSKHALAQGLLWSVELKLSASQLLSPTAAAAAGVRVNCIAPRQVGGSAVAGLAATRAVLCVHNWAANQRRQRAHAPILQLIELDAIVLGLGYGKGTALGLEPAGNGGAAAAAAGPAAAGAAAAAAGAAAGAAGVQLSQWSRWLHDGKVTGKLTFERTVRPV